VKWREKAAVYAARRQGGKKKVRQKRMGKKRKAKFTEVQGKNQEISRKVPGGQFQVGTRTAPGKCQ